MLASRVLQAELLCGLTHVVLVDDDKVDEADTNLVGDDAILVSAERDGPVARVEKSLFVFRFFLLFMVGFPSRKVALLLEQRLDIGLPPED